jgi:Zn-dependent metalloprotease
MKKFIYSLLALLSMIYFTSSARELTGLEAHRAIASAEKVRVAEASSVPEFIQFRQGSEIQFAEFEKWAHQNLHVQSNAGFKLLNAESDKIGMKHYRYQQTLNGIPVEGTMYIVHTKNNYIVSMNGLMFDKLNQSNGASIIEPSALSAALSYMNATLYQWQVPACEQQIKQMQNNPSATWYPKGELVYAPENGNYISKNYRLCYKFDVYALQPLKREYIYIDAASGSVIYTINRIHDANATGTAVTAYSGTHTITTDSVNASQFRLRETGRGQGIETHDSQGTFGHPNTDFTDTDNNWNNVNANLDQYATDAHWGGEMTYDFYFNKFGRDGIDNAGFKLFNYVHFGNNLVNAFWDGTEMNYGDGGTQNGIFYTPLTSLDVIGHEISHGLTQFTSGLLGGAGTGEPGALNESWSDCMGNSIRFYGKQPATIDWGVGDELSSTPFRDMANPKSLQNPNTYLGQYWDFVNQEVHQNSTVMSYCYYLLTESGTGTNDNGDAYTISGLGIDTAAAIFFRMNTVYLTQNSDYAQARTYAIQAAVDLYGPCTNAVIQTTNAWYAVGVGLPFLTGVNSDFTAPVTTFCAVPATVNFANTSNNGGSYLWDFGDGSPLSTAVSPTHIYTSFGLYNVKLVANGGTCGIDSVTKNAFVSVDASNPCTVILSTTGTNQTQTACAGQLFDSGGPTANYQDNLTSTITIAPTGANTVTLTFSLFDMENTFDFLYIYDGPTTASTLIGSYTGNGLPNGGTITSTGSSITLRQFSDQFVNNAGFALTWQCQLSTVSPVANYSASDTVSCTGVINFTDMSTNGPTSWLWDFGDGNTSTAQSPTYAYTANGTYTVSLTVTNSFGSDSLIHLNYITVNLPSAPTSSGQTICYGASANLSATGTDTLAWYTTAIGGNAVGMGANYTTPALTTTTTYYVENDVLSASQYNTPHDNTFGGGGYLNFAGGYLIFDVLSPIRLASVLVYANSAGDRIIELRDNAGVVLQTDTVNLPAGQSRIQLNYNIPVGTNYQLGLNQNSNVDLYRNNANVAYPYTLNAMVSITGSSFNGRYYWFYDWEVQAPPCTSARVPVVVTVSPSFASFTYAANGSTVTFTDNSTGAISWNWNFGDGNTDNTQNPIHTYATSGTYTVTLVVNNGTCNDTATVTIITTGISTAGKENYISVKPNPAADYILIDFGKASKNSGCTLWLNNAIGQTVISKQLVAEEIKSIYKLNIATLAPGIYTLDIRNAEQKYINKIVKQE